MKILVADDDPGVREVLTIALEQAGYAVVTASDGLGALRNARREAPALVVLDVGMPELDGFEVCRRLRAFSDVPVLFLTARDDEVDRVVGLEIGADDYLTKPFSPRELLARIGAVLRRAKRGAAPAKRFRHGALELDPARHACRFGEVPVALTGTEMALLARMMRHPDHVVTRADLAEAVYEASADVAERTLDSHLRNLRRKLAETGRAMLWKRCTGSASGWARAKARKAEMAPGPGAGAGGRLGGSAGAAAAGALGAVFGARGAMLAVVVTVIAATLVLGFLLWRLLFDPITAMAARTTAIRAGQAVPEGPLRHYGTREMGALGQSMLEMTQVLQNREAAIRHFSDHVTHELKTPLAAIRGTGEMLEGSGGLDAGDKRLVTTVLAASARMEAELAALARVAAAREPRYHGQGRLRELTDGLQRDFPALALVITGGDLALPLAPEGLRIVLVQLLGNAQAHGATQVELVAEPEAEGPALTVQDNGAGVSEGNRARILAPFFTTRCEAGGTGMGLNIASGLLQAHGASIRLMPGPQGACFRLEF